MVKKFNSRVEFVGSQNSISETSELFNLVIEPSQRVVFPIGESSRRSIQKSLLSDNWFDFIFYRTKISDEKKIISNFDAVFLSSPSQAMGWLSSSEKVQKTNIFCFKGSTNEYLETQGIDNITVNKYNRECVFKTLNSHLGQTD